MTAVHAASSAPVIHGPADSGAAAITRPPPGAAALPPQTCGCAPDVGAICADHCLWTDCTWTRPGTAAGHAINCLAAARSQQASHTAAARVSFQLTYARSQHPRRFAAGLLTGPDLPCAYSSDVRASGDWEDGGDADGVFPGRGEQEWIDRYANYAINEAVHEALEWLRVDGRPWLDPHGAVETEIYALTNELCERLADLRRARLSVAAPDASGRSMTVDDDRGR